LKIEYEYFLQNPDSKFVEIANYLNVKNLKLVNNEINLKRQYSEINLKLIEMFKNDFYI